MSLEERVVARLHLKRHLRRLLLGRRRIAIAITILVAAAAGLLADGRLVRVVLESAFSSALGGSVSISTFSWTGWGSARLRGMRLTAPGWEGAAGEIATLESMDVDVAVIPLLAGHVTIHDLVASGLRLRPSEHPETGELSVFALSPRAGGSGALGIGSLRVERATLTDASASIRRMLGDRPVQVATFAFTASILPSGPSSGISQVALEGVGSDLRLAGTIDQRTLEFDATLTGFSLNEDLLVCLPLGARIMAERIDPRGTLDRATVTWSPVEGLGLSASVSNCEATAPDLGIEGLWMTLEMGRAVPATGAPRVQVDRASISLDRNRFTVSELAGKLISSKAGVTGSGMPVSGSLTIDLAAGQLKPFNWTDRARWIEGVLDVAPFSLQMRVDGFRVDASRATQSVELPQTVAEFFEYFNLRRCNFDVTASVSRGHPTVEPDGTPSPGTVSTQAALFLRDTVGAFSEFPYLLEGVQGRVSFNDLEARIEHLSGLGSDGSNVTITGLIRPALDFAAVDLTITGANVPVDDRLIASFDQSVCALSSSLFSTGSFLGLTRAEILHTRAERDALRAAQVAADAEVARMQSPQSDAKPSDIAEASQRAASIRRQLELGAFSPGGTVDFTVKVAYDGGAESLADVSGSIDLKDVRLLPADFPLPALVGGADGQRAGGEVARIRLEPNRISIEPPGVRFRTLSGGSGLIEGHVDVITRGMRREFAADIDFTIAEEPIGPLLFAAIPPTGEHAVAGWPGERLSQGGRLFDSLGLRGMVSARGSIRTSPERGLQPEVKVDVWVSQGHIQPDPAMSESMSASGLMWPRGFSLSDCSASISIDGPRATLREFTGRRKSGIVRAEGELSMDTGRTEATVRLDGIGLGEYVVNMVPSGRRADALELWRRYQPRGTFDAQLKLLQESSSQPMRTGLMIEPRSFALTLARGPVQCDFTRGALVVSPTSVLCQGLSGALGSPGGIVSPICVDGAYGIDEGMLQLSGEIDRLSVGGPVLGELLERLGSAGQAAAFDELAPEGLIDADFFLTTRGRDLSELSLRASTELLSIGPPDRRLDLRFDPPLTVRSDSGMTLVSAPSARFRAGELSVQSWLASDGVTQLLAGEARISVRADGPAPGLLALMPEGARRPLAAVGFGWDGGLRGDDVHVTLERRGDGIGIDMDGTFILEGGTMDAGPEIDGIDARVAVRVAHRPQGTAFSVNADGSHASVARRTVDSFKARISRPTPTAEVTIGPVSASVGGGVLDLRGTISADGGPEGAWYVDAVMAGCALEALLPPETDRQRDATARTGGVRTPGTVHGRITVAGVTGDASSRAGSGSLCIRDARLAELPMGLALLQLTQLMLPLNASLNRADTRFSLADDVIYFDTLEADCSTLVLSGRGSMDLSSGTMAIRLRNRGTVPVLSDIVGSVMEQIFQIDLRGTIDDPRASIAPIPAIAPMPTLAEQAPAAGAVR
jgi:hypothetical protein